MKKRTIIIAALLFIVVFYFTYTGKAYQLKDVVKVDEANVTRIEIDTDEGKRVVDDKKEIKQIVHSLAKVEVKKSKELDPKFDQSYWVKIVENGKDAYGLTIYDDEYIKAFNFKDKKQATYTIGKDQKIDVKKLLSTK
ncbi:MULTISPECIES: DUF5301 domain-containing protein [Priestia]|uniref:DUF5301 domain-containing protein n=1 Tax=Priestia TaxID=2800373 RepID=UPI0008926D42|nr:MULTISPECIES: DUF5301 domain-containing protein [Priestia]MBK0008851.1 DUF5301 domain-containing protein [Bacillus sp. S35]SDD21790.1 hypothetical protein SAMN04487777_103102 [Priestia aryabhattai B8W22]MCM3251839.1 DUF5301 domain-containing protein [Priestia aryabhattai]MCM3643940.1 DUF5301 domain-containing protein [Priestia aryabhattai]PFW76111.1 hypothetical protein COL23_12355 [Priestia aryabhattai]